MVGGEVRPPKHINLKTWFREYCIYEIWKSKHGRKYHFFWLPHRAIARIWPFRSDTDDYPEREITQMQFIEEGWKS